MLRKQMLTRARRLAGQAALGAMTDRVVVDRGNERIYDGPGRMKFTGRTEVSQYEFGGAQVYAFAELHIPPDAGPLDRGDTVTVRESLEPALSDRRGTVAFAEPVTSLSGFQRITRRKVGTLSLGNPL